MTRLQFTKRLQTVKPQRRRERPKSLHLESKIRGQGYRHSYLRKLSGKICVWHAWSRRTIVREIALMQDPTPDRWLKTQRDSKEEATAVQISIETIGRPMQTRIPIRGGPIQGMRKGGIIKTHLAHSRTKAIRCRMPTSTQGTHLREHKCIICKLIMKTMLKLVISTQR